MSNERPAAQGSAATAKKLTFKEMSRGQKTVFVLKVIASVVSFGMLFPNLMAD